MRSAPTEPADPAGGKGRRKRGTAAEVQAPVRTPSTSSMRPSACCAKRPRVARVHRIVARPRPAAELRALVVERTPAGSRSRVFITNGPCCDHGLADRPALQQQELAPSRRPLRARRRPAHQRDARRAPSSSRSPIAQLRRRGRSRACGSRSAAARAAASSVAPGCHADRPDRDVRCRRARPTSSAAAAAARASPSSPAIDRDLGRAPRRVGATWRGICVAPQHREVRLRRACPRAGRFSQIWNSSTRVRPVAVEQREHLGVHDARAGGQPLHVARAEARGGAERVGVIDEAAPHDRHRLEAAVRVLREARHHLAVVHAPAVLAREVLAEVAARRATRRGPICSLPAGYASSWCTQNRNGSAVSQGKPRGATEITGSARETSDSGAFMAVESVTRRGCALPARWSR